MSNESSAHSSLRTRLDLISTVAIVIATGAIIWGTFWPRVVALPPQTRVSAQTPRPVPPLPALPLSFDGAHVKGSATAQVGLIEFSEFQCPFCGRFARETLPAIVGKYVDSGQLLIGFRHLPLERAHLFAARAGEIAWCAARRGLFWSVHDGFFAEPRVTSAEEFESRARSAGLRAGELRGCLESEAPGKAVRSDLRLAEQLQIASTPAFLLGVVHQGSLQVKRVIMGARPLSEFEAAIDEQLGLLPQAGR